MTLLSTTVGPIRGRQAAPQGPTVVAGQLRQATTRAASRPGASWGRRAAFLRPAAPQAPSVAARKMTSGAETWQKTPGRSSFWAGVSQKTIGFWNCLERWHLLTLLDGIFCSLPISRSGHFSGLVVAKNGHGEVKSISTDPFWSCDGAVGAELRPMSWKSAENNDFGLENGAVRRFWSTGVAGQLIHSLGL